MKVIQKNSRTVTCEPCNSILEYDGRDLRWTKTNEDYYYIECPICGEKHYIKRTPELDYIYDQWHEGNTNV